MKYEESLSQIALIKWFRLQYPELQDLLVSYPAGLNLEIGQRIRAKNMGLKAGVPDLILFVPKLIKDKFYPCLFIEMKRSDGRLSAVQKAYHHLLKSQGYTIVVCYSFDEARQKITSYLKAS